MSRTSHTRPCPLCLTSDRRELIYRYTTTFCGRAVYPWACSRDTMLYASNVTPRPTTPPARNTTGQSATGSGLGGDHARLESTARLIESLGVGKQSNILDIGAAQAGLLDCLR